MSSTTAASETQTAITLETVPPLQVTDDLDSLLAILPERIRTTLVESARVEELIEVILDLGRLPEARFGHGEMILSTQEITRDDIEMVIAQVGDFGTDNRAGIERTLHRISAMRNRKGEIIGLTCRVGRAIFGTIEIIKDIVLSDKSILLLGRPGVGKTTLLREAARVRGDERRVIVVDTSNEIAGDGDIPHPAIGRARRMQVPNPNLQHEVMIEAVENHMPQVIVIDEIGRELEAQAARTIAERGVQLVGTAHGMTLENLLMNPTLSDLVGGIDSVTLSDEEARRRGTQKSVLERKAPPTFEVLIEIQDRQRMAIHHDVAAAVDAMLRGRSLPPEVRFVNEAGQINIERAPEPAPAGRRLERGTMGGYGTRETITQQTERSFDNGQSARYPNIVETEWEEAPSGLAGPLSSGTLSSGTLSSSAHSPSSIGEQNGERRKTLRVYPYGIGQNRLRDAAATLGVGLQLVDHINSADVVITLKNYYRQQPQPLVDAERRSIPVYVMRSNTSLQMEQVLVDIFQLPQETRDLFSEAMRETQDAIQRVLNGEEGHELNPQSAAIRSQQHQLARAANLISHSYGREPYRRVRIYRR